MSMLMRMLAVSILAIGASSTAAMARDGLSGRADNGVVVYYFGARDCPYCRMFVKNSLDDMQEKAAKSGVRVVVRETGRLRDLRNPAPFTELEDVWSHIVRDSGLAVPAFGLFVDGEFVDSNAGNWRRLMRKAVDLADEPPKSASR